MHCEVLSLDNLTSGESKPILESEAKTLPLDDKRWGRITIPPHLALDLSFAAKDTKEGTALQLLLKSREVATPPSKNGPPFEYRELKKNVNLLTSKIRRDVRDLNAHVATYQATMAQMPKIQADYKQAMSGDANPAQATAATSRLQMATRTIQKSEGGINRLSKSLPDSYEALGKLYALAVLSEQLKQAGQIQFQVVAQAEVAPVVLMVFKAEPLKLDGPVVLEGFPMDPAGTWFQVRGGMFLYDLASNGGCTVRGPSLERPMTGQWSKESQRVRLSAGSVADEFEMVNPFQLRGVNGSLYRLLQ
jgi:hypothetical protein